MKEMKKILVIAALALLVSACGKDDAPAAPPTPPTPPTPPPTEKPSTGGEGEGTTVTPPTIEDLKIYFKISDEQTVVQAVRLVTETTGKQTVNGKAINVTQSNVSARNDQEGKFTAMVKGTISDKAFSKEYVFERLIKKPSDYHMASRAQVQWKAQFEEAPEVTSFAFDELYRLKQTTKFTVQYLSQWAELYSSTPEGGSLYTFTDEDLANTQISEIKYEDGSISFLISYKGIKGDQTSKGRPSLKFDKNKYYKRKVTLNTERIKQLYMQGVYENLDLFYASAINIDNKEVFVTDLVPDSKTYSSDNNTISCQLSMITHGNTQDELARFEFKFEGFKPLTDLKQEWFLATSTELDDHMKSRFANTADGDVLNEITKKYPVNTWIQKAQMVVQRNNSSVQLFPEKMTQNKVEIDVWRGSKGGLDILLLAPRFEVKSAQKTGNRLKLQVALIYVNDVALVDVVTSLNVLL